MRGSSWRRWGQSSGRNGGRRRSCGPRGTSCRWGPSSNLGASRGMFVPAPAFCYPRLCGSNCPWLTYAGWLALHLSYSRPRCILFLLIQLEVERLHGQLAVRQQEADAAGEQLAAARQQLAAAEARASGASRELSSMSALQQRCEELAEAARRALAAQAEAEAEAARLRVQGTSAAEALGRCQRELGDARREAAAAREGEALVREQLREAEEAVESTSRALKAAEVSRLCWLVCPVFVGAYRATLRLSVITHAVSAAFLFFTL